MSPAVTSARTFEDGRSTVIGTVTFCLVWATTLVWARLWTRGVILKKLDIDDYVCAVALVSCHPGSPLINYNNISSKKSMAQWTREAYPV